MAYSVEVQGACFGEHLAIVPVRSAWLACVSIRVSRLPSLCRSLWGRRLIRFAGEVRMIQEPSSVVAVSKPYWLVRRGAGLSDDPRRLVLAGEVRRC